MKSTTSERQRFAVGPISSKTPTGYPASAQVISAGDIQPNTKPFSTGLIQSSIQPIPSSILLFSQPFIIPSSKQPILMNTNFLPRTIHRFGTPGYHHVLTKLLCCLTLFLPVMAATGKLLDLERALSTNLVIKHRDRCITVRSTTEELLIAADYQCTYYQVGKKQAAKKNSMFLSNLTVHISSASYKQLKQLFEVQRVFHFSRLNIEPQ